MTEPYYSDDLVTLYHGDCREISEWLAADVLVTDPPYGRAWKQNHLPGHNSQNAHSIANDDTTATRDTALAMWGERPAIAFGDLMLAPPTGTKLVLIYKKPSNAGIRGAVGGFRRDAEAVYLIGHGFGSGIGGSSSVISTAAPMMGGSAGLGGRSGHPHEKPIDVLATLIERCPLGVIADPFVGSGTTLVVAKQLGRKAVGVELDEGYCETAANRLSQGAFDFGSAS